jgi:hypothetical protein
MKNLSLTLAAALLLACPLAKADTTYTYKGNPLNWWQGTSSPGYVTGSFTLPSPLGDNFNGDVTPVAFSISNNNAVPSFTLDSGTTLIFSAVTNGVGQITAWEMYVYQFPLEISTFNNNSGFAQDIWESWQSYGSTAYNTNTPGTWSVSSGPGPTATPEPSSLMLFGSGLLFLGRKASKLLA